MFYHYLKKMGLKIQMIRVFSKRIERRPGMEKENRGSCLSCGGPVEGKPYVRVGKKDVMHVECYSINSIFLPMDAKIKEVGR
jgi:hypothetical protein